MSVFGRSLIPISEKALSEIDAQAARTLRETLSSRKFMDVDGPKGWDSAGVAVGRLDGLQDCESAVCAGVREFLPFVESRAPFELCSFEMHNIDRGVKDPDLTAVERAAQEAAKFEEEMIYNGCEKAGIKGLLGSCGNKAVSVTPGNPSAFVTELACITGGMKQRDSIGGPYALVGGKKLAAALLTFTDGRSLIEAVKKTTDIDEFVFSPCHEECFIVSKRGGDFELTLGIDFTVGFAGMAEKAIKLFIAESFTFRVLEARAYTPILLK